MHPPRLPSALLALTASMALALAGCETTGPVTVLPVGPTPQAPEGSLSRGYLKVYTATTQVDNGHILYYPHKPYSIYSDKKTKYKYVQNALTESDETPTVVSLPPGLYLVRAEGAAYLTVEVPVVIKPGMTTVVDLDGDLKWDLTSEQEENIVRLPNGRIVGWPAVPPGEEKQK